MSRINHVVIALLVVLSSSFSRAAQSPLPDTGGYLLPLTCTELLPDLSPFLSFFESVGKITIEKDRKLSLQIFRILALREKLAESSEEARDLNPIDLLIRRTLCFYREQKDPTRPVAFDDQIFTGFLRQNIGQLESKVNKVIKEWADRKRLREDFERRLTKNQADVEFLKKRAENEATVRFNQLEKSKKK